MSKHTPGPWGITRNICDRDDIWINSMENNMPAISIAKMASNAEANAKLISSAPNLLEVCKWAYNALKPFSKEPSEQSGIKLLKQAITKAEG